MTDVKSLSKYLWNDHSMFDLHFFINLIYSTSIIDNMKSYQGYQQGRIETLWTLWFHNDEILTLNTISLNSLSSLPTLKHSKQ